MALSLFLQSHLPECGPVDCDLQSGRHTDLIFRAFCLGRHPAAFRIRQGKRKDASRLKSLQIATQDGCQCQIHLKIYMGATSQAREVGWGRGGAADQAARFRLPPVFMFTHGFILRITGCNYFPS